MKKCPNIINSRAKRNRFKKFSITLILILITALMATSCSGSKSDMVEAPGDVDYQYDYKEESASDDYDGSEAYDSTETTKSADETSTSQRKLIKNGSIEIRSNDVEASYENVLKLVEKHAGFNTNLNRSETDARLNIYAEFGIPADKLDQFIEEVNQAETVDYVNISAEDITDVYYDATIRLETSEKSLEKYYEFLADAKKIEDMIHIQGEIDRITEDIELLKGSLKRWDSQVDYSYISIEFLQKQAPVSGRREVEFSSMSWDDFKYWVNSGWNSILSSMVSALQWLAIAILVSLPVIIPILLIVLLIVFIYKRRKKSRLKKEQEQGIIASNEGVDPGQMTYSDMYQDQNINQKINQNNQQ